MGRIRHIATELKDHAPFTGLGALVGVVVMVALSLAKIDPVIFHYSFHLMYPAHMLLSSTVTAAMFRLHMGRVGGSIGVGFFGSLPICMVSDILFPYAGGVLFGAKVDLHICLLEEPWLVVAPGLAGATIGALTGRWTKCPHAVHILISTLASLFYLIGFGVVDWLIHIPFVFMLLFAAVWIPCCTSDIVLPLLFSRQENVE